MKHGDIVSDTFDLSPDFAERKNISASKAKTFWQDQQAQGKIDLLFKHVEKKLQLLQRRIKDGSATDKDYTSAYLLLSEDDFLVESSPDCNKNTLFEQPIDEDESERCDKELTSPDGGVNEIPLPSITPRVRFLEHTCGEACLSKVTPYFNRQENPLRFPLMCDFQRWHIKSSLISRPLDVLYKTPCGKSLRNFDDVLSYLFQTKCYFLFLDYFSFNTFLQLEKHLVTGPAIAQEADISKDVEAVPVSFYNGIDDSEPSPFTYRKSPWPRGYMINNFTDLFLGCCDCTDGCLDLSTCACLQLTAQACKNNVQSPKRPVPTGYRYKRLLAPIPSGLYECNVSCKCDRRKCQNRVVQHGLQLRLQVYKTKEKGWGVRCQDEIDKGTFVCIYAGRIFMKTSTVDAQDTSQNVTQSDGITSASIFCTSKKKRISLSDSEVTNLPSSSSCSQNPRDLQITFCPSDQPTTSSRKILSGFPVKIAKFPFVQRPKTKTSILQKRKRQLIEKGAVTVKHSSEDEDSEVIVPVSSRKPLHTSRLAHEAGGYTERMDDAGYLSDNSTMSIQSSENNTPLSTCKQKDLHHPENEENICVVDASEEGNVARFINHSCSPNLFAQPVFVETHSKKFPWVAFFTKSHINSGTELTWDYSYNIGSVPKEEVPCLCGQKICRTITI